MGVLSAAPPPATHVAATVVRGGAHRRRDIQGLRAVAVAMVVAYHAGLPVPGGFAGVDVFFVISGYVITASLLRERRANGRIRLGRFYVRRFLRLVPALALVLGCTVVAAYLMLSPLGSQQTVASTAAAAMLLCANLAVYFGSGDYFDDGAEVNPLSHTWSLSVEEQFYLAFPIVLVLTLWLACRYRRLPRRTPAGIVLLLGAGSFALAVAGSLGYSLYGVSGLIGFYSPLTRAWEFVAGAALVAVTVPRRLHGLGAVTGGALVLASCWLLTDHTPTPGPWTLIPVAGAMLLITCGGSAVARLLGSRPLARAGDWSYSIYLWHWPFLVLVAVRWPSWRGGAAVAVAASLIVAVAAYRWVEQPLRELRGLSRPRFMTLAAAMLAPVVLLALGLRVAAGHAHWSAPVRALQSGVLAVDAGNRAGCTTVLLGDPAAAACRWHTGSPGAPVYLAGDSQGGQYSDALITATATAGRPLEVATRNGCPVLTGHLRRIGWERALRDGCRTYQRETLRYLGAARPGAVYLAMTDVYFHDPRYVYGPDRAGATADPARKVAGLGRDLTTVVSRLRAAGHTVVLVLPSPRWLPVRPWLSDYCDAPAIEAGRCRLEMTVEQARRTVGATHRLMRDAAQRAGARVLDVWGTVCPGGRCSTDGPGYVRYRDALHLSVPQSLALAPVFAQAMAGP